MWNRLFTAALLAAAMTWASAALVRAAEDEEDDGEDGEVQLKLDEVPEAVREALVKEAGGAKFDSVEREVEGGKTVYEIEVVVDGKTWEIEVDENGKLLEKEMEGGEDDDDAADDDDAKPAAAKADRDADKDDDADDDDAKANAKGEDEDDADDDDGKAEAKADAGNDDAEDDDAKAGDEGDAEEGEETVKLEQLPPAVKKALMKEAGKGQIKEIEKETEDGRTVYEAEVTAAGKTWEITFSEDGKVLEKELDDEEDEDEDEGEDDDD